MIFLSKFMYILRAQYVHPRANDFFVTSQLLKDVLAKVAQGTDRRDDPILGLLFVKFEIVPFPNFSMVSMIVFSKNSPI
jgi:hypothetical protein